MESVRSAIHRLNCGGTCQISIPNSPNLRREAFDQGRETGKALPNLVKYWFFKKSRASRQSNSRRYHLVRHKDCGDSTHNLVQPPAAVGCNCVVGGAESVSGQIHPNRPGFNIPIKPRTRNNSTSVLLSTLGTKFVCFTAILITSTLATDERILYKCIGR